MQSPGMHLVNRGNPYITMEDLPTQELVLEALKIHNLQVHQEMVGTVDGWVKPSHLILSQVKGTVSKYGLGNMHIKMSEV